MIVRMNSNGLIEIEGEFNEVKQTLDHLNIGKQHHTINVHVSGFDVHSNYGIGLAEKIIPIIRKSMLKKSFY